MAISINYCMKDHLLFAPNHTPVHTFHVPQNFTGKRSNGTRLARITAGSFSEQTVPSYLNRREKTLTSDRG